MGVSVCRRSVAGGAVGLGCCFWGLVFFGGYSLEAVGFCGGVCSVDCYDAKQTGSGRSVALKRKDGGRTYTASGVVCEWRVCEWQRL